MAADHMSDISVQRRSGVYTGHASAAEFQGIHVPRGEKRGCGSIKPKRCMLYGPRSVCCFLTDSQNLQSAEEMQKEEEAAQSAKLQELIRRGGPEDLQEANRLMKVMAGYDTRHKTDYRAKAAEEVSKVQQKAKLLEERLQNFKEGDTVTEGDVFEVQSFA